MLRFMGSQIDMAERLSPTDHACLYLYVCIYRYMGFPGASVVKNPPANAGDVDSIEGNGNRLRCLPGKTYRLRSLVGYTPWCHKSIDMT